MPPVAESRLSRSAPTSRSSRARSTGRPLVYLDSAATSQKPQVVIDALADHLRQPQRQRPPRRLPARAGGRRGLRGRARAHRRRSPGRRRARRRSSPRTSPRRSTSSPTRGAAPTSAPGDAVLITQMEHHANIVPWQLLCRERGAELRYLEVDEHGELSLAAARRRSSRAATCAWSPSPTSRTCSARSTRSRRSPHVPARPAP